MNKFLGILFFYTLAFNGKTTNKNWSGSHRMRYLQSKSERYLNHTITESEWKLLNIYLKDITEPLVGNPLTSSDLNLILDSFDEAIGLNNIDYELRMHGIDYDIEMQTIDQCFDNLSEYIEIIGSSNGVSVVLGDWLEDAEFDRTLIDRFVNLKELID